LTKSAGGTIDVTSLPALWLELVSVAWLALAAMVAALLH